MEWVETTGRTVEEAKDAALDQLGVDEQDAEFDIVEEPRTGLFGRVRSEARVRARVRPTRPRPKDDRRNRKRGDRKTAGRESQAETPPAARRTPTRPARPANNENEGAQMDEDVPLDEQVEIARTFLTGLLDELGATGVVAIRTIDEDTMELVVSGDDLGLLIGPKGATLSAVQDLTRTVVQRQTGARNGRLLVDVSGYREKRREALERFTRQVADEVLASGARKVLEPMHPADRKVVHDTANTIDGVSTSSEGEDPRRRVVISPV